MENFGVGFLAYSCPYLKKYDKVLTLANCLAGGIMLTLGIVYVLREAIEIFEEECGLDGCLLP